MTMITRVKERVSVIFDMIMRLKLRLVANSGTTFKKQIPGLSCSKFMLAQFLLLCSLSSINHDVTLRVNYVDELVPVSQDALFSGACLQQE